MFELANATAKRGLPKQQYFGRAPKATVTRCCHSVSNILQIDVGRSITTKCSMGLRSLTILATTEHSCH